MNKPERCIPDAEKFQIATGFLNSLKSRDWQTMRTLLTEDASWTLPGKSLLSGEAAGADAIVDRARKLRNFGVTIELFHVLYSLNGVALSLHNTASRGELELDEYVVIAIELRDEKIARLTTHLQDVMNINRFFTEGII